MLCLIPEALSGVAEKPPRPGNSARLWGRREVRQPLLVFDLPQLRVAFGFHARPGFLLLADPQPLPGG